MDADPSLASATACAGRDLPDEHPSNSDLLVQKLGKIPDGGGWRARAGQYTCLTHPEIIHDAPGSCPSVDQPGADPSSAEPTLILGSSLRAAVR